MYICAGDSEMCKELLLLVEVQANTIQRLSRELALLQDYLPPTIGAAPDKRSAAQLDRVSIARVELRQIGLAITAHTDKHGCGAAQGPKGIQSQNPPK